LKVNRPHLGTDLSAAKGTPIRSVGDGTVLEAGYNSASGNYVKIRHNGTYTTGYLHMSKFGSGIRQGVQVKQAQVIGYVGSTGWATGPHLCYRFWKNGIQVDALRVSIPPAKPVEKNNWENYMCAVKNALYKLNATYPLTNLEVAIR
jgi:murein DD-endopeptidase MepM/ murein hydrolase activator NlpD